uniref:Protein distal antenna n=1 Tax=Anopheles atroparvus TaxID=41427 RepID=A0AAG5CY50_ANOAO
MMMMATATKGKRPLRHLTATDKIDAIQRIHDGESKASVARDIGVPESTLRGWCKNEEKLRYMSRQSVENAEKLSSEATAAALTAAAAAELFSGPPEKRLKLDSAMFGGNGKLNKYEDSFYKVAAAAAASRGSLNGLDLSGGGGGGGGGGGQMDKSGPLGVSGGDIIMNGLAGSAADFSQFAKTAAEISALSKSKAYGAELSKHHHHHHHGGGDPSKSDHHLSMAAISPLTSLSHLSGMSGLGQSPLALSFNDIATNLNLFAQLNNNHSLATMSSLAGGLNTAAAAAAAAQSLRNVRPKGSGSSAANNNGTSHQHQQQQQQVGGRDTNGSSAGGLGANNGSGGGGGGGGGTEKSSSNGGTSGPSLTVRNLAKLQQQKSSSGELLGNGMLHQQPHAGHPTNLSEQYRKSSNNSSSNNHPATSTTTTTTTNASVGRDPNAAPVDDALWYWLKSQQTMLGLNNLYSSLPRATSHSPPTPPPPSNAAAHLGLAGGSPTHHQQTLPSSTTHTPQTPPPPLVAPPLVSTPQPTPPSSAPSLTPEDTKNSSWFWQWYKTFGASLMPGGAGGGGAGGASADSKQQQREQQHQAQQAALAAALHHNNNNSLSQQNNNNSSSHHQKGSTAGSAAAAASLTAAYENILYSQLTKGTTTPSPSDTLNNNHHHHLNHHLGQHHQHHHLHASLSSSEPIDLNIGQQQRQRQNEGDPKPEDLSNHHHHHHLQHGKDGGAGMMVNGDGRRSRYNNPSRPSSASSAASSSISAHHRSEEGGERMGLQSVKVKVHPDELEDEQEEEEESVVQLNRQRDIMDDDVELEPKSVQAVGGSGEGDDVALGTEDDREDVEAGANEDELTENHRCQQENEGDEIADDGDDEDIRDGEKRQQSEALTDDGEELKESSAAGAKRRRSSAGASAKEVLDSILYNSNSNDRTIDSTSSPAITPSPIAMVRERSVSPAAIGSSVHNNSSNNHEDELIHKGGADSLTGDDIKSEMSDDSNHTPAPSSSTALLTVASVAVADIRNSTEAVEHGEKFLKWLEACSDPNVTAMQVMQFKYLLNSIKLSAERQQLQTSAASGGTVGGAGSEERTRIRKRK